MTDEFEISPLRRWVENVETMENISFQLDSYDYARLSGLRTECIVMADDATVTSDRKRAGLLYDIYRLVEQDIASRLAEMVVLKPFSSYASEIEPRGDI